MKSMKTQAKDRILSLINNLAINPTGAVIKTKHLPDGTCNLTMRAKSGDDYMLALVDSADEEEMVRYAIEVFHDRYATLLQRVS